MLGHTSVPLDLVTALFGVFSPPYSHPCPVLYPAIRNVPRPAIMVAGSGVGAVRSRLSFSHGPLMSCYYNIHNHRDNLEIIEKMLPSPPH